MCYSRLLAILTSVVVLAGCEVALAQSGPALCTSYDRWTTSTAEAEILDGDGETVGLGNCYGANWDACDAAWRHYATAFDHLAQIFNGAATGSNCLRCDISTLRSLASELVFREKVLYGMGYRSDLSAEFTTIETWAEYPYCQVAGAGFGGTAAGVGFGGTYVCVTVCQPGLAGSPAYVSQSGSALTFTNEAGAVSRGAVVSPTTVVAQDWSGLIGTLVGTEIHWANGTIWRRQSRGPEITADQSGPPTSINIQETSIFGTWGSEWVWNGDHYEAHWSNGTISEFQIETFTAERLIVNRKDIAGPSTGLVGRYVGTVQGNTADGTCEWTFSGWSNPNVAGKWSASW